VLSFHKVDSRHHTHHPKAVTVKRELEFHADALPGHVNPDDEAEGMPINYVQLAIRYKWRLLAGAMAGLILGHLAYLRSGPEYDAFAQILVSRKYTPPVREEDRVLTTQGKPSEDIPLITSPMLITKALRLGDLTKLPILTGATDPVEAIQDGLKVRRMAGNDRSAKTVLEVRFASPQSADSRTVVESVIAAYDEYLREASLEQSAEVQRLAKKTTEEMFEKLHEAQEAHRNFLLTVPEEFRSALGTRTATAQTTNIAPEDVIHSLGEERNRNRVRLAELTARQKSIEKSVAKGESYESLEQQVRRFISQDGRNGDDAERQTQLAVYQSQLMPLLIKERDLAREFGRDHPELVAVRRGIETIIHTYAKLGLRFPEGVDAERFSRARGMQADLVVLYLDALRHQVDEHQLKDRELANLIQSEGLRGKDFSGYLATDQDMKAKILQLQELWQKQLDRENGVAIEKDTNGYSMKTLAPVKHELVFKKLLKFDVGGAACMLLLVALTCLVQELKDFRLKNIRDVRVSLRQPVLGSVAAFNEPVDRMGPSSKLTHPALRYLLAPNSVEAENYRSIRTSLLVSAENRQAKTVLISSPEPGDGKTTLASNLAIALAQSGKRVLLMDADLRRPSIHKLFRVPQEIGLTDVLVGEIELLNAVRQTTVDRLSLLTAGQAPANPAELLSSPRMAQLLRDAKHEFDFVFVDSPPLLAVSDPCILARHVDGMLLVIRVGKNTRTAAARVRELINNQGIAVLGTVANGIVIGQDRGYSDYGAYISSRPHIMNGVQNEMNGVQNELNGGPTETHEQAGV
jgi:polysaccharide biosynthesis transport protein